MEVWFYFRIGTAAEKPKTRGEESERITLALLRSASGELCPLDKDLSWKSRNRKLGIHMDGNGVYRDFGKRLM